MNSEKLQDSQSVRRLPKQERLKATVLVALFAIIIYPVAYFGLVSVRYIDLDGHGINWSAIAYYKIGPFPQIIARAVFKPLQFCDAHYLRPERWNPNTHHQAMIDGAVKEWKLETDNTNQPVKAFTTTNGSTVYLGAVSIGGTNVSLTNVQVK